MSVNSANYAIELEICDYNADYFKYVIRVETDPTDPTGVYRQEEIIDIPEDEVTDIYSPLMDATEPVQQNSWLFPDDC